VCCTEGPAALDYMSMSLNRARLGPSGGGGFASPSGRGGIAASEEGSRVTSRDRTDEFLQLTQVLRGEGIGAGVLSLENASGNVGNTIGSSAGTLRAGALQKSAFNKLASNIGQEIHRTSQKLGKLAKLAGQKSLFDDPADEIAALTMSIKGDITTLNEQIDQLQAITAAGGGTATPPSKQAAAHSGTVVQSLKSRLMDATKEFKSVLQVRTENVKAQESRKTQFSAHTEGLVSSRRPLPFALGPQHGGISQVGAGEIALNLGGAYGGGNGGGDGGMGLPGAPGQQLQQRPPLDYYTQSRADALQNVESTISELGQIFNQLSSLVAEQGEQIIRIDDNMEESLVNVENAQTQLLKYLNRMSTNRWLMLKIFGIFMFFLFIFIVFLA